jgi:predicted nucleotidyltransferase
VDLPGAATHEGSIADADAIRAVLREVAESLDASKIPYVVIGGMASALLGRPRCSSDIDLLVKPQDAGRALGVLGEAGFTTEQTNPHWLYKAFRDGVLVDLLFKVKGDIYLDDEMLARAPRHELDGQTLRLVPPEALIVMKALVHDEETPRHWYDALGLIANGPLDWEYLLRQSRKGPQRVLSLLVYASSMGLPIPREAIRQLVLAGFELPEPQPLCAAE